MRTGSAVRGCASSSSTDSVAAGPSPSSVAVSSASSTSSSSTSSGSAAASAVTPRGEMVISLVFDSLVAGLICASFLGLCLVHELFQAAHGGFHGFRISARLGGANLIAHAALFAARASSANAGDAVGERPLAFHVRTLLEQAAHHALSNVARQRLQAGLALRLVALRERLGGSAPFGVLELGDDAARGHALGERRVLRHELDEHRLGPGRVRLIRR